MNRFGLVIALVTIVGVVGLGGLAPLVQDLDVSETGQAETERPGDVPDAEDGVSVGASDGAKDGHGPRNKSGVNGSGGQGGDIGEVGFPAVLEWLILLALAVLVVNLLYGSIQGEERSDSGSRSLIDYLIFAALLFAAVVLLGGVPGVPGPDAAAADSGAPADPVVTPSLLVGVLAGIVLLVGVGLLAGARRADSTDEAGEDPVATRAVGTAAGRAAADVGERDLSNVIYRAWNEMTSALAVPDAESATPAEFASEAVDAGMAPEDVETLTTLFREVRYGKRPVTETRERRARDVLRRIETRYAGNERGTGRDSVAGDERGAEEDAGAGDP